MFAGVWEAGALLKRVEVLHKETQVLLQFVPTVPTRVTWVTLVLGAPTWGPHLAQRSVVGSLGIAASSILKCFWALKVHSSWTCDN